MTDRARLFVTVMLLALGIFLAVGLGSVRPNDWPFDSSTSIRHVDNPTGPFGSALAWVVVLAFGGVLAWVLPVTLVGLGIALARDAEAPLLRVGLKVLGGIVLTNAFFAVSPIADGAGAWRGKVGDAVARGLTTVFGEVGSAIVLVAAVLLIMIGEAHRVRWLGRVARAAASHLGSAVQRLRAAAERRREIAGDYLRSAVQRSARSEKELPEAGSPVAGAARKAERWAEPSEATPARTREPEIAFSEAKPRPEARRPRKVARSAADEARTTLLADASLPPLTILEQPREDGAGFTRDELKSWSGVLEEKLSQFGVEGKVVAVHHGPVVTTFEFEPAPGVRIKDIVSRSDDLALAMRAKSLRMIAPIPGRAVVGMEIPNPVGRTVYLHEVLSDMSETQRVKGVMIGLGVDVVGKPFLMNLCDAPHLLIAGTTGSGKSVCLNTILASILLHYRPSDVCLLLVDPKMVEMSQYNGIPHLLHPVITDPKDAARVLEYLVAEMGRRNDLFRRMGVRNVESYNAKVAMGKHDETVERLPYIVLVVDELGDLALAKGVDIETLLTRLAQMARAAGIHMILATQRPSVDVIVGKTKANFPTRIAFRVATKVDSRTILDTIGADKLLGRGDMLYLDSHHQQPARLHGAWVSEGEIEHLIQHWKSYRFDEGALDLSGARAGSGTVDGDLDPLFEDARGVVVQYRQGSTSLLQRKLHVGYSRAARLLDQLEQQGVVGPPDGSKPREVYVNATNPSE